MPKSITDWKLFRRKVIKALILHNENGTTNVRTTTELAILEPKLLKYIFKYHGNYVDVVKKLMDEGKLPNFVQAERFSRQSSKRGKHSLSHWENLVAELLPIINTLGHFPEPSDLPHYINIAIRNHHTGIYDVRDRMEKEGFLDFLKTQPYPRQPSNE